MNDHPPSSAALNVLLVEDSHADAELVLYELKRQGFRVSSRRVDTPEGLADALRLPWDAVIADDALPQSSALQTVIAVAAASPVTPVIVVSGVLREEAAVEVLQAGARDFVTKQNLARLGPAVRREVSRAADRQARLDAERARAQLASIVESSSDAIFSTDLEGTIVSWNASARRVYGYATEEIVGVNVEVLWPAEEHAAASSTRRWVVRGERVEPFVAARRCRDGSDVVVEITLSPVVGDDGAVVGISSSARDLTSERQAAERDRAFRLIFENALDAMVIADDERRYVEVNEAACTLFGVPKHELLGRTPDGLVELEEHAAQWQAFVEDGSQTGTVGIRRPDGEVRVAEYAARANILRGRHLSILRDVTDRRQADEHLRQSRELYELVVTNSQDVIALLDLEGKILFASPAAERTVGGSASLEGTDLAGYVHPDDIERVAETLAAAIESNEPVWTTARVLHSDGHYVTVEGTASTICDADGKPSMILTASRDVSERERRKELEAQLQQAQKLEAIGRLAGGIAHDFNNILTAILGYSELALAEVTHDQDGLRNDLHEIHAAAERAGQMTRQLLAFSRRQVLRYEPLDLNEIIRELNQMLGRLLGADIDLSLDLRAEPAWIMGDRGQLTQVVLNLCVNARDAMRKGGRLTIMTRRATDGDGVSIVTLDVADTGAGIDDETRRQMFDPFFTTKGSSEGTGLGLSTVLGIVEQSGGSIAVDTSVGHGTTFTVTLPASGPAGSVDEVPESAPARGDHESILLVEDEQVVRELVEAMLVKQGYRVVAAADAEDALAAMDETFALLITDVMMPHMNGRELAERLRVDNPELAVLFMSGYTDDAVPLHGVLTGSTPFLQKPFTIDQLTSTVQAALQGPVSRV